jgi:hypothetical protein
MSSQNNGVLAKIKTVYKNAIFQLNLILERVAHQNKPVTIFFASIKGFSKFFSWSPKRTQIGLKKIATRRASNTRYPLFDKPQV